MCCYFFIFIELKLKHETFFYVNKRPISLYQILLTNMLSTSASGRFSVDEIIPPPRSGDIVIKIGAKANVVFIFMFINTFQNMLWTPGGYKRVSDITPAAFFRL